MKLIHMRPTHYTYHREGPPPRFRLHSDEAAAYVRLEFAARADLLAPTNAAQRTAENYFDTWAGGEGVAGQQLCLTGGKLTYDMPMPLWRKLGEKNYHIFYRASATARLPANWSAAGPDTVRTVDDSQAALGLVPYFGVPHDRLYDPWTFTDQEALNQVPAFYRSKLELLRRYPETHEDAYLLRRLVGHENYFGCENPPKPKLPVDQRIKALTVFAATNRPARRAILQLFDRSIPPVTVGGREIPAVRSTDLTAQAKTLLDNLARLVEIDPHMEIPDTMDAIIADALAEVADPHYELNQGTKGTCVPTSVQWIMVTYFPAEYVRLLLTLLTQEMRATLANGDQVTVPPDTFLYDPGEQNAQVQRFLHRSWSERVFQASMMNYARPGLTYSNLRDVFTDNRGGITPQELVHLLTGLRNRPFTIQSGSGSGLVTTIRQRLQSMPMPILTAMLWGPRGPNQGRHRVVSVAADAMKVTIRNPWGRMDYRAGDQIANPPRTCSNPSRGEETLNQADMADWVEDIVVEN